MSCTIFYFLGLKFHTIYSRILTCSKIKPLNHEKKKKREREANVFWLQAVLDDSFHVIHIKTFQGYHKNFKKG